MSYTRVPLDPTPLSVREARAATRRWLRHVGRSVAEHPATLVVSELVTNSVVHARDPSCYTSGISATECGSACPTAAPSSAERTPASRLDVRARNAPRREVLVRMG